MTVYDELVARGLIAQVTAVSYTHLDVYKRQDGKLLQKWTEILPVHAEYLKEQRQVQG